MGIIALLNKLGNVYYGFGDYAAAQAQYEESLLMARELNAKPNIAMAFNTTSIMLSAQGDLTRAQALQEESLAIRREMGNKLGSAYSLGNLAHITRAQGDFSAAHH
jgi:tetratricopeptide (TPR) repeat protein